MDYELFFKINLIVLYSIFTIIRIHFSIKARKANSRFNIQESKIRLSILQIYIAITVILFFMYVFISKWFDWGLIPFYPLALRFVGLGLGIGSLIFFYIVHFYLGRNFSYTLRLRDNHTLVTSGPYRFIRHPMYSAFILFHTSFFLITQNWFFGIVWIGGLIIILLLRVNKEEEMLIEVFGDKYSDYKKRTGSLFFPIFKLMKSDRRNHIINKEWNYEALDTALSFDKIEKSILVWLKPLLNEYIEDDKTLEIIKISNQGEKISIIIQTIGLIEDHNFTLSKFTDNGLDLLKIEASGQKNFVRRIKNSYESNASDLSYYIVLSFGP
ncbi:MAG: isoprenylcysteine carboxylmethyltransferase family protein [Asgard group archaeon]|nr:isoprenylcysteine carboxylmethyltransferase family protein [Asgard group archaeon]